MAMLGVTICISNWSQDHVRTVLKIKLLTNKKIIL